MGRRALVCCLTAALLLGLAAGQARAARLRFHFVPGNAPPGTCQKPGPMVAASGERISWLGSAEPAGPPPRPSTQMTYRHPYSGQMVTVPLTLPFYSTPQIY